MIARQLLFIYKRIHHPELDILDVLCLEVRIVQLAHHASPLAGRVSETSVSVKVGAQIIGSAFGGVECEVEHIQAAGTGVAVLLLLGIEFALIHFTHIVVGELVEVALDVAWGECAAASREDGVHIVPCQQGAVVAIGKVV